MGPFQRQQLTTTQNTNPTIKGIFEKTCSEIYSPSIIYLPGVVHNGMQIDSVLLNVPSRAIPGSLKASMSLTGMAVSLRTGLSEGYGNVPVF